MIVKAKKLLNFGSPNSAVALLSRHCQDLPKRELVSLLDDLIKSPQILSRLTDSSRQTINQILTQIGHPIINWSDFAPYTHEIQLDPGTTWLPLAGSSDPDYSGSPLLRLEYQEKIDPDPWKKEQTDTIINLINCKIRKALADWVLFNPVESGQYTLKFESGLEGIPFTEEFEGNSFGLPYALALFSSRTGLAMPSDLASTGELSKDGTLFSVLGVKEKAENLSREWPQIKRLLVPEKTPKNILENPVAEIQFLPVNTLNEAITICWPDVTIKEMQRCFKLSCEEGKAGDFGAVEIKSDSGNLSLAVLRYFPLKDWLDKDVRFKNKILLFNNFLPTWLNAYIGSEVKNRCIAAGTYFKTEELYFLFYSSTINSLVPGQKIHFTPGK